MNSITSLPNTSGNTKPSRSIHKHGRNQIYLPLATIVPHDLYLPVKKKPSKKRTDRFIPYEITDVKNPIPDAVWLRISNDLSKPRLRDLAVTILSYFWDYAFTKIILPREYLRNWRYHPRDVLQVIDFLVKNNWIQLVTEHCHYANHMGQARVFQFNPERLQELFPLTHGFYPDIHYAIRNKFPRRLREINIPEPDVAAILRSLSVFWNGAKAMNVFLTEVAPNKRQDIWEIIRHLPSDTNLQCNWKRIPMERGARYQTDSPDLQGLPEIFRRSGILTSEHEELWNIDYTAQHTNILLSLNHRPPVDSAMVTELTGLDKSTCKNILNPFIAGQTKNQYLHKLRIKGKYTPDREKEYNQFMTTMQLSDTIHFYKNWDILMWLGSEMMKEIIIQMATSGLQLILPIHDGVLLIGDENDALKTKTIFEDASELVLGKGFRIPANISQL